MKNSKKMLAYILVFIVTASLFAGCNTAAKSPKDTLTVGLVQFIEHTSLDEIRTAFEDELETLATEKNMTVTVDYKNAQGEINLIPTICRGFVQDEVDVIVAIATPSAQGALSVTTDVPIIFSAVTDPVGAGLLENFSVPEGNITGVSDAIDVESIFSLADELTPGIETYGLIYNKSEDNSVSVIQQVKEYLESQNIGYVEKTVGNSSEVQLVTKVLLEDCDGMFVPIDNTVASAMSVLAEEAKKMKVPVYTAADSLVQDGGLATVGVNYTELGKRTADMTLEVLQGAEISSLPVQVMEEGRPVVNEDTAKEIGVSVEKYID